MDVNEATRAAWIRAGLKALPKGSRLLDAGAGEQQYRDACAHLDYVSQDFAQYKPETVNAGLQMEQWNYPKTDIVCDITSIPEKDESFDAILCSEVLEHVPDPVVALRELSRLLRKNGTLLLTAPFCSLTHFAPYHFSTGFNRYFYEHHLPLLGLKIEALEFNGNYFAWLGQELGRLPSIAERYTGNGPGRFAYRKIAAVRQMLEEWKQHDNGSTELLAFGCHVRAVKK